MNTATGVSSTTNTTRTMSSSTGSVFSGVASGSPNLASRVTREESVSFNSEAPA